MINGHGAVGIESSAGSLLGNQMTVFAVIKPQATTIGADQKVFDARSDNLAAAQLIVGAPNFRIAQGLEIGANAYDSLPHVITCQFNADASSQITVSDIGQTVGDAGSENWDFMTLFSNELGGEYFQGWIGELAVFDRALDAGEITQVETFLQDKWL